MSTITISSKTSNSGSIYDLASEHGDIEISMGNTFKYAVVIPSYYNGTTTRHKTEAAATKAYRKLTKEGYEGVTVLDLEGNEYYVQSNGWDRFIPTVVGNAVLTSNS